MNGTQVVVAAVPPPVAVRPAIAVRPAGPADLAALGDFFAGLSADSRYLRFFAAVTPSPGLLRRLSGAAGAVDAVIAVAGGVIIGHGMAADRTASRGDRITDIGVVVADAWQGGGIGSALVRTLVARAQARGVTAMAMDVLPGNHQVLAMIARHWPTAQPGHAPDYVSIEIDLQQAPGTTSFASPVPAPARRPRRAGIFTVETGWNGSGPSWTASRGTRSTCR
jgi:ribosomal protein S18 acetylase RimI-like enzyme